MIFDLYPQRSLLGNNKSKYDYPCLHTLHSHTKMETDHSHPRFRATTPPMARHASMRSIDDGFRDIGYENGGRLRFQSGSGSYLSRIALQPLLPF